MKALTLPNGRSSFSVGVGEGIYILIVFGQGGTLCTIMSVICRLLEGITRTLARFAGRYGREGNALGNKLYPKLALAG